MNEIGVAAAQKIIMRAIEVCAVFLLYALLYMYAHIDTWHIPNEYTNIGTHRNENHQCKGNSTIHLCVILV